MHILITNDDGINAPGIKALAERFSQLPNVRITVCAPHLQRSAQSHSLTFHDPLRILSQWSDGNVRYFAIDGTPTDCVMMAVYQLCKDDRPDILMSGVNCGANMGYDVSYSATVSSALEGIVHHIPALAVSLVGRHPENYAAGAVWAEKVLRRWLPVFGGRPEELLKIPESSILSLNVPDMPAEEVKGVKFTRQGRSIYRQDVSKFTDPWGRDYYWIHGDIPKGELDEGSDFKAVYDGWASLTPLNMDLTDDKTLTALQNGPAEF